MPRRIKILVILALPALMAHGCGVGGTPRAPVSGRITLDGKPLATGMIRFIPTGSTTGPAAGGEIVEGKYSVVAVKGPMVGEYKVEIISNQQTGKKIRVGPGANDTVPEFRNAVPAKYNSATELRAQIGPGENVANFDLQSK